MAPSVAASDIQSRARFPEWAHLAALLAVAAILTSAAVVKPLWNNEFITLKTLALPLGRIVYERVENNHMPAYFLALKCWTDLFGKGEISLRFISAIFSLASVAMVWRIARWAWGKEAALAAGWMAVFNSYLLYSASQARMYTMVEFLTLLSMFLYLRLLAGAGRKTWGMYFAVQVLGLATHLLFAIGMLVQAFHIACSRKTTSVKPAAIWAALALSWMPVTPLFVYWVQVQYFVGQDHWHVSGPNIVLRHLMKCLWGEYDFDSWKDVSQVAGALLMVLAIGFLFKASRSAARRLRSSSPHQPAALLEAFLPWWFLVPAASLYLASLRTDAVLNSLRYYGTSIAAGALVAVCAWRAMNRGMLRRVYLAGALGLSAWYGATFLVHPGSGLRQAVAYIAGRIQTEECIVAVDRGPAERCFAYYGVPELDPRAIEKRANKAELREFLKETCFGRSGLWVILYHEGSSPIVSVLGAEDSGFEMIDAPWVKGQTKVFHYRIVE